MIKTTVLAAAAAAAFCCAAAGQEEEYLARRAALAPGDEEGLLELGTWCMDRGGALDMRGRECFEDLIAAHGSAADRARGRLARWHLTRGRGYADARLGVGLLFENAAGGAGEEAARELDNRRLADGARKKDEVDKAMRSRVAGRLLQAARALAEARRLPFGEETGDADLSDRAIFDAIDRARRHAEGEGGKFSDPKLPFACPKCSSSGFEKCEKCDGKGKVQEKTKPERVLTEKGLEYRPGKLVTVKCRVCGGSGKTPCETCRATGIDFSLFDEEARRNFLRFGAWLKSLSGHKDPVKAVERAFAETIESRLRVPAALKVSVNFPLVPPTREKMDVARLGQTWEEGSEKDKIDLLRGVTVLSARWLEPFFFSANGRKTLGVKEPFREKPYTVPLAPEIVGADPEGFEGEWVRVAGEVDSVRGTGPWAEDVLWINVKGREGPHNLKFFLWREASREKHAILGELHADFQHLKRSLWTYPFTLEAEAARLPAGGIVVFYGRTVYAPEFSPSHAIEIWAMEAVADRTRPLPPKAAPVDPSAGETRAEKAALLHGRALDSLRSAASGPDAGVGNRKEALADLRLAVDHWQAALAEEPEDAVIQESYAATLGLLHRVLAGKSWLR